MGGDLFPMEYKRLLATLIVLTVGLGSLAAVVDAGWLVGAIFTIGFLVVVPLVAVLGDSLSFVADGDDAARAAGESFERGLADASDDAGSDPVERLRDRYARGEIDEAEFERRLERLLETEDLERRAGRETGGRDRELDLE